MSKLSTKAKRLYWYKRDECSARGLDFDLDIDWLYARIIKGCELTKLPFNIDNRKAMPTSPSIDRINPSKGYTKDNCRLILNGLNCLKGAGDDSTMYAIAQALTENAPDVYVIKSEPNLSEYLTDRQIEILHKKLDGDCLTKTEGEYFSRNIKKKLRELAKLDVDWAKDALRKLH